MAGGFGTLIAAARERRQLSQADLARLLERSKTYVVDVENGRSIPSDPAVLVKFARSLRLDPAQLFGQALRDRTATLHGVADTVLLDLGETLLASADMPIGPQEIRQCAPRSYREIATGAEKVARDVFAMAVEDGVAIPILDALVSAREVGLRIGLPCSLHAEADDDLQDEAATIGSGDTVTIKLRPDVWERAEAGEGRYRFTAAHELGHAVLHHRELSTVSGIAFRDAVCTAGEKLQPGVPIYQSPEWQANTFASALLMPRAAVVRYIRRAGSRVSVEDLAATFKVSQQAARIRFEKLLPELVADPAPSHSEME